MESYGHEMIWMVEMLTSNNTEELAPRDTSRKLEIPIHVMDLMYFGRAAGEAADLIANDDIASIMEHCPALSKLAAIVANNADFFDTMHDHMRTAIVHIIAALDTEELQAKWNDGELAHRDFIATITWLSVAELTRGISIEAALSAVVNSLENVDDLNPDSARYVMSYMNEAACSKFNSLAPVYMHMALDRVLSIVSAGETLDGSWREKAMDALLSIDFKSEVSLTQGNEQIVDEVMELLLEDSDLHNVAITVGWLAAIYRYTPYRQRIEEFFDLEILDIGNEDHQEDTAASPEGLAA